MELKLREECAEVWPVHHFLHTSQGLEELIHLNSGHSCI